MAQPVPGQQRRKMTPLEMYEKLLRLINSMNVSLSTAVAEINEAYSSSSKDSESGLNNARLVKINDQLNKVMNGITGLTSIYTEARQRAIVEQGSVAAAVADKLKDTSTQTQSEAIAKVAQQTIKVANDFTAGLKDVSSRVSEMVDKTTESQLHETATPQYIQPYRDKTSFDVLLGEDGLMFSYLSSELHPLGKGSLRPCDAFPAYIEDVSKAPVEDLIDYPEGFYNTRDGIPSQLFLKIGPSNIIWNFGLPNHDMLIRHGDNWISLTTFTRSTVRLMTNQISTHLWEVSKLI